MIPNGASIPETKKAVGDRSPEAVKAERECTRTHAAFPPSFCTTLTSKLDITIYDENLLMILQE